MKRPVEDNDNGPDPKRMAASGLGQVPTMAPAGLAPPPGLLATPSGMLPSGMAPPAAAAPAADLPE